MLAVTMTLGGNCVLAAGLVCAMLFFFGGRRNRRA